MKPWKLKVNERPYEIKLGGSKVIVNNEKIKLKSLNCRREGMFRIYEVPVGEKTAELYVNAWIGGTILVMDGKDCATGEEFVPVKLPKWAYVFVALHCLNLMNGALGALLAILGVGATVSVSSNPRFHTALKLLIDICLVILSAAVVFGMALLIASI